MYFIGVYSSIKNKIKYLDHRGQVGTYVFPFIDYQLTSEKWWLPGPSRFIALKPMIRKYVELDIFYRSIYQYKQINKILRPPGPSRDLCISIH